jgi:hypothetical protein
LTLGIRKTNSNTNLLKEDKWEWDSKPSKVGEELRSTLLETDPDFYIGLPCEDWKDFLNTLMGEFFEHKQTGYISYATLFINKNYGTFKKFLKEEVLTHVNESARFVLIANEEIKGKVIPWAKEVIYLPNEIIQWWEANDKEESK